MLRLFLCILLISGYGSPLALGRDKGQEPSIAPLLAAEPLVSYTVEELNARWEAIGLKAQNGITLYRLQFLTFTPQKPSQPIIASGLVAVPDLEQKSFPWISLQHGTIVAKGDAPSKKPREGLYEASQGFVTLVQDYIGFGSSSQLLHPYLITKGYTRSSVDFLRAARGFAARKGFKLKSLFLQGYSEGGYATLALQKELETKYAREFPLRASSPNAGPYDMETLAVSALKAEFNNPLYTAFIILALDTWGNKSFDPQAMFNYDVGALRRLLASEELDPAVVDALPVETRSYLFPAFLDDFVLAEPKTKNARTLRQLFVEQSLNRDSWGPQVPTRFHHCIDDEVVPVFFSEQILAHFQQVAPTAPISSVILASPDPEQVYTHGSCPLIFAPAAWFKEIMAKDGK